MSVSRTARLGTRLTSATGREQIGAILVRELLEVGAADGAVVWLPRATGSLPDVADLFHGGSLFEAGHTRLLTDVVATDAFPAWMADLGAARCLSASCPPHVGRVALAWRQCLPEPSSGPVPLELVATLAATVLERERLREQAAVTTASLEHARLQVVRTRSMWAVCELAPGIAHDLNNCLTTILGLSELASGSGERSGSPDGDLFTTIGVAALDAATLVRRLQTLSTPAKAGEVRHIADVRDIVRAMPELARPRWSRRAELEGVGFEIVLDAGEAPPVHVAASEIREVILNLLFNAIDAMPSGGRIILSTGTVDGWPEIAVRDEGTGMSSEVLSHVFEPFFTTKGDEGTGLGLSVCQTIAEAHGGTVTATSAPGSGTTFTLRLPPAPVDWLDDPLIGAPTRDLQRGGAPAAIPNGGQRRILLVDDQDEVRESIGEMLRALGHHVVTAHDGPTALALAEGGRVDVVITDYGMPGMSGAEVATRLRAVAPDMPVVLITGWGVDPETPPPQHVAVVLGKPVTMGALDGALASCARDAAGHRSIPCS